MENYTSSEDSSDSDSDVDDTSPESGISQSEILQYNEQVKFSNFYESLVTDLVERYSLSEFGVTLCLLQLVCSYKRVHSGHVSDGIDFNELSYCVAYLHRYAACHTGLVHDAMTTILDISPPREINVLLRKRRLNVVFLGGGPGNDFVGFLSALWGKHEHLFEIHVTVMDTMTGWKTVFTETVQKLRQGNCGRAGLIFDEVNVISSFLEVDLINPPTWNSEVEMRFENADMIFLVKFLSHVSDEYKYRTLENVVRRVKPGTLLFYIDGPVPSMAFLLLRTLYCNLVFESEYKWFNFIAPKSSRFRFPNIVKCRAAIRVFVKC